MQKRLFFLTLCCLSANVWAQQPNTNILLFVARTYTQKTDNAQKAGSNLVVFYTERNNSDDSIQNAVVWDRKTQTIAIQNIKKSDFSADIPHNYINFVCIRIENQDNGDKISVFIDKTGYYARESNEIIPIEHFIWRKEWSDDAFTQDGKKGLVWKLESSITDMPKHLLLAIYRQKDNNLALSDNTPQKFTWLDSALKTQN